MKISVATYEFELDIRTALQTAMRMHAEGVEIELRSQVRPVDYGATARRQLLNYVNECNLKLASAHFLLRHLLFEPDRLEERIAAVKSAIEFASDLRIRTLTIRAGRIPAMDSKSFQDYVFPVMQDLAAHGNRFGVTLCLKPAGDPAETLLSLIDQIKTGPVLVDADLGGWVLSGKSPESELRKLHAVVGHIEVRDGVRDVDGIGQEVPVGRGEIDWDEIAALLAEMDYQNWLNVRRSSGEDKIGDSARAIKYLRNLLLLES